MNICLTVHLYYNVKPKFFFTFYWLHKILTYQLLNSHKISPHFYNILFFIKILGTLIMTKFAWRKSRAFYLQGNSCIPTKETKDKLDSRCCNRWECNYLRAFCLRRWASTSQVWWRFTCCHGPMEIRIRCASSTTPTIAHSLSLELFLAFFHFFFFFYVSLFPDEGLKWFQITSKSQTQ